MVLFLCSDCSIFLTDIQLMFSNNAITPVIAYGTRSFISFVFNS